MFIWQIFILIVVFFFQTGVYSNTVVLQHHSVVMTKADKIYKVKCTYDMSSKNITFGMMPIRLVPNCLPHFRYPLFLPPIVANCWDLFLVYLYGWMHLNPILKDLREINLLNIMIYCVEQFLNSQYYRILRFNAYTRKTNMILLSLSYSTQSLHHSWCTLLNIQGIPPRNVICENFWGSIVALYRN